VSELKVRFLLENKAWVYMTHYNLWGDLGSVTGNDLAIKGLVVTLLRLGVIE